MLCFFDTNVLVYLFDSSDALKQQRAIACFRNALEEHTIVLSTQVLHEFYAVTTRKLSPALPQEVAAQQVRLLCSFSVVESTAQSVCAAMELEQKHHLSWWDALVLEAALRAKADVLYSEDFSHGQRFGQLAIFNPFQPNATPSPGSPPSP